MADEEADKTGEVERHRLGDDKAPPLRRPRSERPVNPASVPPGVNYRTPRVLSDLPDGYKDSPPSEVVAAELAAQERIRQIRADLLDDGADADAVKWDEGKKSTQAT